MARRAKGEGSIHRRADGKWVGRLHYIDPVTGLRRRLQTTGPSKTAVNRELKEIGARVEGGASGRDATTTFGSFGERWIESSLESSDRKQSTKVLYAGLARSHIIDSELGRTKLSALRPTTVERFITLLRRKGLSSSSVRRPKVTRNEAASLTPVEVAELLTAASASRYAPLFDFLVKTGLRRGEALGLRWADVDLERRMLRVQGTQARIDGTLQVTPPKSARSRRSIPLSAPAIDVLLAIRERTDRDRVTARQLWQESGFVFVTDTGEPCDPRNALRALQTAARQAGLPGVGLHTLRHSAASVMLAHSVPLTVVSQILGHSGIGITADVYGHVAPEVSRAALDVLAGALDQAPPPKGPGAQETSADS